MVGARCDPGPTCGRTPEVIERHADSAAPTAVVWALLARPDRWPAWAPHVRGAWGLAGAGGEVTAGARGAARLAGVLPVPVRVTAVDPGWSWTWRVAGLVDMEHRVAERGAGGSRVTVTLAGPAAARVALALYAPLVGVLVTRLARIAEREPATDA